ncbi:tumor necrosis factor alpha-induced protein 3-like [Diadema antillarum]|uniref:tumor necrosis factor alpha-induced protein 3-like n=1 Tax=Diadema antillarum TaxID=105358 RepID=UPI003A875EF3
MTPHPEDKPSAREKRSPLGLPPRVGDADPQKVVRIWDQVEHSVHKAHGPFKLSYLGEMNSYTASLPYFWDTYSQDFVAYLKQELVDLTFESVLTYRGVLNPLPGPVAPLYPMSTTGDGNCLLHAISLALWGVEDTELHLRTLLHEVMMGEFARNNEARWKRDRSRYDTANIPTSGFRYNSTEWSTEWDIVVDISSPDRRMDSPMGLPYACLEEFHIFVMANILRRPIIVLADNMWRNAVGASLQPLNFSGVYLPLAWEPEDCFRYPIVLAFHQMHFTPLFCTAPIPYGKGAQQWKYVVPLANYGAAPLTVHFLTEEEEVHEEILLRRYLQLESIPEFRGVHFAKLSTETLPPELDVFDAYMRLADVKYRFYAEEQFNPENAKVLREAGVMSACNGRQLREKMLQADARHSEMSWSDKPPASPIPGQTFSRDALGPLATSITGPPSTGLHLPEPAVHSKQSDTACATAGCRYQKAEPSDEYCLRCLAQTPSGVEKMSGERCLTPQCLNSGERDYQGYCKVCFEQTNFMNDEAPSANSRRKANIVAQAQTSSLSKLQARGPPDVDQSWQQTGDLNTNIINKLTVGSKKCVQPNCEFTGHPKYEGMCSKCYKASRGETNSGTFVFDPSEEVGQSELGAAPAVGPLMTELMPVVGKQKCLVPECELTGRPDKEGLCSGCYLMQAEVCKQLGKDESRKSSSSPTVLAPISPSQSHIQQQHLWNQAVPRKCRTERCEMFATPAQDGLCSKCFKEAMAERVGPPSPSRLPPSPSRLAQIKDRPRGTVQPQGPLCFTVKKNMCAIPGCSGVRIGLGEGDMCMRHYEEHYTRKASGKRTPSPLPLAAMPAARVQPTAPPPSIYSHSSGNAHTLPKVTKSGQRCLHPKCDEPAAPPNFVVCHGCMLFVARVNQILTGIQMTQKEPLAEERSSFTKYRPNGDSHANLGRPRHNSDNLMVENLNMDISEAEKKSVKIFTGSKRPCKTHGGCPFQEYGNPRYDGRCEKCFDRDVVAQYSQIGHSRTAPVQKTGRQTHLAPNSQSEVIISTGTVAGSGKRAVSPSNFMECVTFGCKKQANPQILDGYCNDCYPTYKRVEEPSYGTKKKSAAPKSAAPKSAAPKSVAPKSQQQAAKKKTYKTELGAKVDLCRMPGCKNYGNEQCQGYCNGCFRERFVED